MEIEKNPEVLLLGKDPEADSFWDNICPRANSKSGHKSQLQILKASHLKESHKQTCGKAYRAVSTELCKGDYQKEKSKSTDPIAFESLESHAAQVKRRKIDDKAVSVSILG